MLKKSPGKLSLKFVLFIIPLVGMAVIITAAVLAFHHYRVYNLPDNQLETYVFHTLLLVLPLIVLLCCAAGILGGFWINRQLQSFQSLQQHMRSMGDGRLDRPVAIEAPYEIEMLARGLNNMAASLKQHIHGQIETIRKKNRQETEAFQKIAIPKLLHEMRNFLNNIDLVVHGLKPENLSPRGRKILSLLVDDSGRVKAFLRLFLRFAKPPDLHLQPCRFESILTDVIAEFEPEAGDADIRIKAYHSAGNPSIHADAAQIHAVMQNLIRNSLEAIGRSGMIRIETNADTSHLQITIFDSGPGMDDKTRVRMFEPFFTTRKTGDSAGLGLAISRNIIEAHAGTIECESTPGNGTTFRLRLPLS